MPKEKIVIVDDDISTAQIYFLILKRAGFEIALLSPDNLAPDEVEARIRDEHPDAVIADLNWSGMERQGLELMRALGNSTLPFILYTNDTSSLDEIRDNQALSQNQRLMNKLDGPIPVVKLVKELLEGA